MELLQRKLKEKLKIGGDAKGVLRKRILSTITPNILLRLVLPTLLLAGVPIALLRQKPALAETCTPLAVVKGEGTQVKKTVTLPSIPLGIGRLFNTNWNTDFVIPSNAAYKKYVATLIPEDSGTYSIRMNLKYSDGTHDQSYNSKPKLTANQILKLSGNPRINEQPYQVNIFVGDTDSVGKSYQVSVSGCR
jgi:hypothetical protein